MSMYRKLRAFCDRKGINLFIFNYFYDTYDWIGWVCKWCVLFLMLFMLFQANVKLSAIMDAVDAGYRFQVNSIGKGDGS